MSALLTEHDLPTEVMDFIRSEAAVHNRSATAEVVELLRRLVDLRRGDRFARSGSSMPPALDPPTVTDEGPPPGDIPFPGPGVRVYPKPGGALRPEPPAIRSDAQP